MDNNSNTPENQKIPDERIFENILDQANRMGIEPGRLQRSRDWFRGQAQNLLRVSNQELFNIYKEKMTGTASIGSMFSYQYDPKWKEKLPYYDMFPLVFPFEYTNNGFYGLNLHYLAPSLRAKLMDSLYTTTNNRNYNESTALKINYKMLSTSARYKLFRPCVKRYLYSHVKTRFMYILPQEWDIALFLPTARFKKQTASSVWIDSVKKIK